MDGGVEQALPPALGVLTIPGVLGNVGESREMLGVMPLPGSRMVKKLMRLRTWSISGAPQAVHDTASGLGAPYPG